MINEIKPNIFNFYVSLKNILRFFKYVFFMRNTICPFNFVLFYSSQ